MNVEHNNNKTTFNGLKANRHGIIPAAFCGQCSKKFDKRSLKVLESLVLFNETLYMRSTIKVEMLNQVKFEDD